MRPSDEDVNKLVEALIFYAEPQNYFGILIMGDNPCGAFIDDVSDSGELGHRHGAKAREVLKDVLNGTLTLYDYEL